MPARIENIDIQGNTNTVFQVFNYQLKKTRSSKEIVLSATSFRLNEDKLPRNEISSYGLTVQTYDAPLLNQVINAIDHPKSDNHMNVEGSIVIPQNYIHANRLPQSFYYKLLLKTVGINVSELYIFLYLIVLGITGDATTLEHSASMYNLVCASLYNAYSKIFSKAVLDDFVSKTGEQWREILSYRNFADFLYAFIKKYGFNGYDYETYRINIHLPKESPFASIYVNELTYNNEIVVHSLLSISNFLITTLKLPSVFTSDGKIFNGSMNSVENNMQRLAIANQ